jgi:hypothetical protein
MLENLTNEKLKKMAKKEGYTGYSSMKKSQLVRLLRKRSRSRSRVRKRSRSRVRKRSRSRVRSRKYKQGYNDRKDESIAMRRRRKRTPAQLKASANESYGRWGSAAKKSGKINRSKSMGWW